MNKDYKPSDAELMFHKLGYYKYECKYLGSIMYRKRNQEITFMLECERWYAQINDSDINFGKYRPMEIDIEEMECIKKQIEEFGWKGKSRE